MKHAAVRTGPLSAAVAIQAGDIVVHLDRRGRVIYWNAEAAKVFGYGEHEAAGQPLEFVFPATGAGPDRARFDIARVMAGRDFAGGFQCVRKNRDKLAVYLYATAGRDAAGRVAGVVCVAREVTHYWRAEQAIRASEEKYGLLLRSTSDAVVLVTRRGRILEANEAASVISGYPQDELARMAVADLVVPERRREVEAQFRRILTQPQLAGNLEIKTATGGTAVVEYSATAIESEGQRFYFGIARDVTGRVRSERAVRESEVKYRRIFAAVRDAMYLGTLDGTVLEVNEAACRMLGYTREELLGRRVENLVPEAARVGLDAVRDALMQHGEFHGEAVNVRRDGTEVPVDVSCSLVDLEGRTLALVLARDATERLNAARALRESEANFRELAANANDGILIAAGPDGRHVYANQRAADITGYTVAELLERGPADLAHPEEKPSLLERYRQRVAGETVPAQYESRILRKDSTWAEVELTASRTVWMGHAADLAIVRDVTQRKRAEEQLRLMAATATHLLRMPASGDIEWYVADRIRHIVGDAVVAVNTYREEDDTLLVRHIEGITLKQTRQVTRVLGADLAAMEFTGLPEDVKRSLAGGRLASVEDGIFGVFFHRVPEPVCSELERIAGVKEAWSVGLSRSGKLIGSITILPRGGAQPNADIIETVASQFSAALERRAAQDELRRERDRAEQYLDVAEVILVALNRDGEVTMINRKGCRILGCAQDEVIGKKWFDEFIPEHERDRVKQTFARIVGGNIKPAEYYENAVIGAGGERRIVAWHNGLLRDDDGNIVGTLSSGEDVTERKQAETALAESQRRLATLLSNLPGMAYRCRNDAGWTMEYASEGSLALTGHRPDELLGDGKQAFSNIIHPADRALVDAEIRAALQAHGPFQITYRLNTRQGQKWAWEQGRGVYDETGQPVAFEGFITDITERRRAEEGLRASEERYSTLFRDVPIGIYRTTPDGRILLANPALVAMLGFDSVQELRQRNLETAGYGPTYQREAFKARLQRDGQIIGLEADWARKDGKLIHIRESARLITAPDGTALYEGTVEDVTERRRVQAELLESEARYHRLFDLAPDGIAVHQDGRIVLVNPAGATLLGYDRPDELVGLPVVDFVHPDERKAVLQRISQALEQGRPAPLAEERFRRRDGTYVWVAVVNSPFMWQGRPAVQVVARDISERKRLTGRVEELSGQMRAMFEKSSHGIAVEYEGRLVYANSRLAGLYGYDDPAELFSRPTTELVAVADRNRVATYAASRLRGEDVPSPYHFQGLRQDGSTIELENTVSAYQLEDRQYLINIIRPSTPR